MVPTTFLRTSRVRRRTKLRLSAVAAIAALFALSSTVLAANATGINVKLPAGFTISGTIENTSAAPIVGATVLVFGTGGTATSGYASTNASGVFSIKGLNPGGYLLTIGRPSGSNYQNGYYTTANANHFIAASASATTITVGPNKTGLVIKVPAGFSISGTVTTTGGAPLAGISVIAIGASSGSATTNASGAYTIKGLAAGSFSLLISPQSLQNYQAGYYTSANTNHFTPNTTAGTTIAVGPSKTGVNIKLPAGFKISGTIENGAGTPLQYANVYASAPNRFGGSASTDASGNYTIVGLSSGSFTLSISAPYGTPYLDGYYTSANANHYTATAASATGVVVGPNKTGLVTKLPAGFSISGTIETTGNVALQYAYVTASGTNGSASASTDAAGHFTLVGLPAGSYKLDVSPPYGMNLQTGYYTTANANHFIPAAASATLITVGPNKTGVVVKLPVGFTISGKVTGPTGTAIQSASVSASSATGIGFASTNASGIYTIVGLSAGTYTVHVSTSSTLGLQSGYYTTANSAHFTAVVGSATGVTVGP